MEVIMKYTSFYPMVALSALFMGTFTPAEGFSLTRMGIFTATKSSFGGIAKEIGNEATKEVAKTTIGIAKEAGKEVLISASDPVFNTDMIKKTVDAVATSDLLKTALLFARQNKLLIGAVALYGVYNWATKKQSHTIDSGNTAQTIATALKAAKDSQGSKIDSLKSTRASLEQLTKQSYFSPWDWAVSTYWLPWQKGPLYESCVQNFLSSRVAIRNAAARLVAAIDDNKNDAVKNEDIELILSHTVQFAL